MFSKLIKSLAQVKQEFLKITWTTKKQALMVMGMVFLMVFLTSLYFFLLDLGLSNIVNFVLGIWE